MAGAWWLRIPCLMCIGASVTLFTVDSQVAWRLGVLVRRSRGCHGKHFISHSISITNSRNSCAGVCVYSRNIIECTAREMYTRTKTRGERDAATETKIILVAASSKQNFYTHTHTRNVVGLALLSCLQ